MAHLTQYSSSVPVIKFHIDQTLMTIGQDIEMDICVPEDGIADKHASVEAVKQDDLYRFFVTSHKEDPLELNSESVAQAELKDGDWIGIGGVEFQFTDDGDYDIKDVGNTDIANTITSATVTELKTKPVEVKKETVEVVIAAKEESKSQSTQEFLRASRMGRRITAS